VRARRRTAVQALCVQVALTVCTPVLQNAANQPNAEVFILQQQINEVQLQAAAVGEQGGRTNHYQSTLDTLALLVKEAHAEHAPGKS